MSTMTTGYNASHRTADPTCPNCTSPLQRHGEGASHYWSCTDCNLVFLA
jgi:ribosomal protein L37AE/L43A